MSGPRLLIGASRKGQKRCGAVYDYGLIRNKWRFKTQVVNPGCTGGDDFGDKLALSGTTAAIGAPGKHASAGAAYVVTVP
jgi:FG-GAP repeat